MTETNGLKDAIACDTRISAIENDRLSYAGYDIAELMENNASFEEVIYLLWNLHLPTQIELNYFEKSLRKEYAISDAVEQCILIQSRRHLHPMSVLRSTVSLLGYIMYTLKRIRWKLCMNNLFRLWPRFRRLLQHLLV